MKSWRFLIISIIATIFCGTALAKKTPPKKDLSKLVQELQAIVHKKNVTIADFKLLNETTIHNFAQRAGIKTACTGKTCIKLVPKIKKALRRKTKDAKTFKMMCYVINLASLNIRIALGRKRKKKTIPKAR